MTGAFDGLERAGMVPTPPGYAAYQRDSLSDADRESWDTKASAAGGRIESHTMKSTGLRPSRQFARSEIVTYYLIPEVDGE